MALPETRLLAKRDKSKFYFTGKPCSRGLIANRLSSTGYCQCHLCIEAKNASNRLTMQKAHRANPDKFRKAASTYYTDNKHKIDFKLRVKKHRDKTKQVQRQYLKIYRIANRDRYRQLHKNWQKENPCNVLCRRMLSRLISDYGIKKTRKTHEVLGYSANELKSHIERLFRPGMSWNNHGEWHVDHIVPIVIHIKRGETRPEIINALSNLQPLWAKDNISKGGRL